MRKWLYILLLSFVPAMVWANGDTLCLAEHDANVGFHDTIDRNSEDFVTVSLVICDPYEVLYSSLGHAALRLQCPTYNLDYVFTYEGENVRNQIWTFLKGDLKMGMYALPTELFLKIYESVGRGVQEYKMNLSPVQEQELWRIMDKMQTAGMTMPYDFYERGCAKSVVMVIKKIVGRKGVHYAPWSEKYSNHTIRELGCMFVENAPWNEFISYFLIGTTADRNISCEEKLIVPTDLVEVWQQATFDNGKPVLESEAHVLVEPMQQMKAGWFTPMQASILLLLLALGGLATCRVSNKVCRIIGNVVDYAILAIQTLLGLLMTYLVCFSSLPCTEWNWLIIPFNILPAICWYWRKYWALPLACILLVWDIAMTGQLIWGHVIVDWPHIILVLAFVVVLIKQYVIKKQTKI